MITTNLEIILLIALALIFARLFGHLFDKIKQPAVIGEILAGVFLGGMSVWIFHGQIVSFSFLKITLPELDFTTDEFSLMAEIGILFMLFISGLQTSLPQLKKMGRTSSYVAIGGVIAPLIFGMTASVFVGFSVNDSIIIGLILVATSVGVTVRTLLDLNRLDTDVGTTILGSAVIDDILGIILLAFFLGTDPPLFVGLKIAIFFSIFLLIGLKLIDKILNISEKIILPKSLLSISLAILLIFAFFANQCGIAGIIGAFIAGLVIGQNLKSKKIIDDVQSLGYGFFIPLFFVWVGARLWGAVELDAELLGQIGILTLVMIGIGSIGKIVGCSIGARLAKMNTKESLEVGVGMIPRMELALIIVSTAVTSSQLSSPTIEHILLTSTVILTIFTTLVTPILIKLAFKNY
ncbi:MAG: cation:proton antiporter [Candidatus Thermoplasmatota archaeon]|nr:cation:proton antiporter [Candidatus Thermoplasmatota archaeon]